MNIIGLTGGTGSGKSLIAKLLSNHGAIIIDADKIGHDIILKGEQSYEEIVDYFGLDILDENKEIIRKNLGELVFNDESKLDKLNEFTHKHIRKKIVDMIESCKLSSKNFKLVVIDAALLFEVKLNSICDEIWVVYANEEARINRIILRDGISYELAKKRIKSQRQWEEYKDNADVVIDNSGSIEITKKQVNDLMKKI